MVYIVGESASGYSGSPVRWDLDALVTQDDLMAALQCPMGLVWRRVYTHEHIAPEIEKPIKPENIGPVSPL